MTSTVKSFETQQLQTITSDCPVPTAHCTSGLPTPYWNKLWLCWVTTKGPKIVRTGFSANQDYGTHSSDTFMFRFSSRHLWRSSWSDVWHSCAIVWRNFGRIKMIRAFGILFLQIEHGILSQCWPSIFLNAAKPRKLRTMPNLGLVQPDLRAPGYGKGYQGYIYIYNITFWYMVIWYCKTKTSHVKDIYVWSNTSTSTLWMRVLPKRVKKSAFSAE